ncbi:MAG: NAD(P)H-hydrate dehydratase [Actinomycetaceae bacterium]|nr:NAD(P)H-hydrate dehydratase [Actinomycetaceae bacterium]
MWHSWPLRAVRESEAEVVARAATDQLMLKAARAVADAVRRHSPSQVAAFAGVGDNGGDALYALSFLALQGVACVAVVVTDHPHERALQAAVEAGVRIVGPRQVAQVDPSVTVELDDPSSWVGPVRRVAGAADVWVDALLGTGASGSLREPVATVVRTLSAVRAQLSHSFAGAARSVTVVCVDVLSGTCGDDGRVDNPVLPADEVVTMGAVKASLVLPPARYMRRDITVVDLGLDLSSYRPASTTLQAADVAALLLPPSVTDHKYSRPVVRTVCGSARYPGAGVLSALAAQYSGASMVRVDAPAAVTQLALAREPGLVTGRGRAQALVVGSGMVATCEDDVARIEEAFVQAWEDDIPVVVDAGALEVFARLDPARRPRRAVLTPHAGEAAQLLSTVLGVEVCRQQVEDSPYWAAKQLCCALSAMVVLKGAATVVVGPASGDCAGLPDGSRSGHVGGGDARGVTGADTAGGLDGPANDASNAGDSDLLVPDSPGSVNCYVQDEAPGWAATAGSGDVLAGAIGTALAMVQTHRERLDGGSQPPAGPVATSLPPEPGFWSDLQGSTDLWGEFFLRACAAGVWLHGTAATLAAGTQVRSSIHSAAKLAALAQVRDGGQLAVETLGRIDVEVGRSLPAGANGLSLMPRPGSARPAAVKEHLGHPVTAADIASRLQAAVGWALDKRR